MHGIGANDSGALTVISEAPAGSIASDWPPTATDIRPRPETGPSSETRLPSTAVGLGPSRRRRTWPSRTSRADPEGGVVDPPPDPGVLVARLDPDRRGARVGDHGRLHRVRLARSRHGEPPRRAGPTAQDQLQLDGLPRGEERDGPGFEPDGLARALLQDDRRRERDEGSVQGPSQRPDRDGQPDARPEIRPGAAEDHADDPASGVEERPAADPRADRRVELDPLDLAGLRGQGADRARRDLDRGEVRRPGERDAEGQHIHELLEARFGTERQGVEWPFRPLDADERKVGFLEAADQLRRQDLAAGLTGLHDDIRPLDESPRPRVDHGVARRHEQAARVDAESRGVRAPGFQLDDHRRRPSVADQLVPRRLGRLAGAGRREGQPAREDAESRRGKARNPDIAHRTHSLLVGHPRPRRNRNATQDTRQSVQSY